MKNYVLAGAIAGLSIFAFGGDDPGPPALPDGPRTAAELWGGGRKSHPAVLNPAAGYPDGKVIRLGGEWDFMACDHPHFGGSPFRKPHDYHMGLFKNWGWRAKQNARITVKPRKINVPGTWEAQGVGSNGMSVCWQSTDNSPKMIRHKYMGDAWYHKRVEVPSGWKSGRVWLKLGGLRGLAHVWVNGSPVALINDYCATRKFDVTDLIGEDRACDVVVELNNVFGTNNGYFTGMHRWGGICRVPELELTPRDCWIDDAWARGDVDLRKAQVMVEIGGEVEKEGGGGQGKDSFSLRATVDGATAQIPLSTSTSSLRLEVPLRNFRPWSPESPNLYTAKVELVSADGTVLETRYERFGVRKIEVAGSDFKLNGKPLYLRGFGDDAVYPLTGMPLGEHAFYRPLLAKARRAGFIQVRTHTHCEFPEYFDVCDELGIIVQPELPYYCDYVPDGGAYDPPKHLVELYENYRRHPSFCIYGMGNEGSNGRVMDRHLHELAHGLDPDRLAMNQSGDYAGVCTNAAQSVGFQESWRADYVAMHPQAWARRCPDRTRPYTVHEYLNLCTKLDYRDEPKYVGAWLPPVTRKMRADWLGRFGLGLGWGARLQDAQIKLQRHWQQVGVEDARLDPDCDGYCFWTAVDVTVWNPRSETYSAQGLFNPFWETKRGGFTAEEFAAFNSASCVMATTPGGNRVYAVGETIAADVFFAHYGDAPIADAVLTYALRDGGRTLAEGCLDIGTQALGAVRKVASLAIAVPSVARPRKVRLTLTVGAVANGYDCWLFPAKSLADVRTLADQLGVVVATAGSSEAEAAESSGRPAVIVGETKGVPNVRLGWWWMGPQVGTALKDDPALAGIPHEGHLSPLIFRIFGKGLELPQPVWKEDELLIVTEGGEKCFVNLAGRALPAGGRLFKSYGLDLLADKPESNGLLESLVTSAAQAFRK